MLMWWHVHAEAGKSNTSFKFLGGSMLYSACNSGLYNEIHGLVDLNFVI